VAACLIARLDCLSVFLGFFPQESFSRGAKSFSKLYGPASFLLRSSVDDSTTSWISAGWRWWCFPVKPPSRGLGRPAGGRPGPHSLSCSAPEFVLLADAQFINAARRREMLELTGFDDVQVDAGSRMAGEPGRPPEPNADQRQRGSEVPKTALSPVPGPFNPSAEIGFTPKSEVRGE
jgi:hypothetical protein